MARAPLDRTVAASTPAPDARASGASRTGSLNDPVASLMSTDLVTVAPTTAIAEAARLMRERRVSCVPVIDAENRLLGLVTEADMTARVVAAGRATDEPIGSIMTRTPRLIAPEAPLHALVELLSARGIAHAPVVDEAGRLVGMVTQSDLVRRQSDSPLYLLRDVARQPHIDGLAGVVARVPELLRALVDSGERAGAIGRAVSAVTDAVTRRLVAFAIAEQGAAPVRWAWVACGSQGRREQSGVSDQDNALVLADDYDERVHGEWFERFARFVCDGLDRVGYPYCPGDMMATNPAWRQPVARWRARYLDWIAKPGPEARLHSSVMFDLRVIDGETALYASLQREVLTAASSNTLFIAHMSGHVLGFRPPLGLLGRLVSERGAGGIDMKHRGIVPVVDLARLYALSAAVTAVNTAERLAAEPASPGVSPALSRESRRSLAVAWETIGSARLAAQAREVHAGRAPDNRLDPRDLSGLEREQLRDAFVTIRDIQRTLARRALD